MHKNLIRKAAQEDLNQIINLIHQLSPPDEEWSLEYLHPLLKYLLKNEDYYLNVCQNSNSLIGTSALIIMPNLSHSGRPKGSIQDVVVDEKARSHGIGKLLISDLLRVAKERNCYKVVLDCENHNVPFYQKCGFYRTGEVEMRIDL